MSRYTITESVGNHIEAVNNYRDLEKHHPSSGRQPGREYQTINGELEEVRTNRPEVHVKKDFIIDPPTIPAPVSGTIRSLNDDFNTVQIVDNNGNVLAQALHMARGSQPANGTHIEYGQTLGRMGDVGSPGSVHAHVEAPPAVFERYINDITSGRIQSNGAAVANNAPAADAMADGVLRRNEQGPAVRTLQEALTKAGYSTQGTDGKFGQNTEDALKRYQQSHGLEVDGVAGSATLKALRENAPAQQPSTSQPSTVQPSRSSTPDADGGKTFLQQQSPETRAYLDLVAWKEVGHSLNADGSPAGYRERNGVAGSKGLMPESAIADNGKLPTSELRYNVGRYQMNGEDVKDMHNRYDRKIDDFSPESQDRIAVAKMQYRGVTQALENGDIRGAIQKGGKEWASLPGSPYGQVQAGYTADQAVEYYNKRLAFHQAQDRGQTTPGQTAPTQGENKPSENKPTQQQNAGPLGDGMLKQGEKGEDVRKLQEALNKSGATLETDGKFGPATKSAVENYQRAHNLDADGVAGPKTLAALGMQQQAPANPTTPQTDKPQAPANAQPTPTDKPQTPPGSNTTVPPPTQTDKPLMSNPNHPDNKLYAQAVSNLEQLGPSGGFKSREDLEKAAAAVAADAKATGLKEIDHISKTNAPNGQSYLVAVQGDPTSPAAKNSYIDYNQATSQTVAQSTQMAEAQKQATPAVPTPDQQRSQDNAEPKPKTMLA